MLTDELIARRPQGRKGLAAWYAEVFQAQDAESLSTVDLATLLCVSVTNLYYWRRRLRRRESHDGGIKQSQGPTGLVRVDVPPDTSRMGRAEHHAVLEVRLSNSRTIVVPPRFDPIELQQLVATLGAC